MKFIGYLNCIMPLNQLEEQRSLMSKSANNHNHNNSTGRNPAANSKGETQQVSSSRIIIIVHTCRYCRKPGHLIVNYLKRLHNNSRCENSRNRSDNRYQYNNTTEYNQRYNHQQYLGNEPRPGTRGSGTRIRDLKAANYRN